MSRSGDRNGQTLGKQLLRLRVVADEGGSISFSRAVVCDGLFKGLISVLTLFVDYLWALWDDQRQTLHDKAVATYVVTTAQAEQSSAPPATPPVVGSPSAGEPPAPATLARGGFPIRVERRGCATGMKPDGRATPRRHRRVVGRALRRDIALGRGRPEVMAAARRHGRGK